MMSFERWAALAASVLVLAVAGLASPIALAGQGQGPGSTPTFLAIPESYPDVDGPVVVLREPGRNIILLRESEATPEALSVALALLGRLTERTPLRPGLAHMAPVTGYHLTTPLASERYAELDELLTRLRERPMAQIGNLGWGRSMPLVNLDG